ncbi:MAG: RidA family protein [Clostridiales bacterium]|nr:RidA family protein [Clostridiales bacterium]
MRVIDTKKAPAAIGPYSQAIAVGNLLYTSGQIPLDPATGAVDGDDIVTQTERAIANLGAVLEEAGTDFTKVVKTTCFLSDMKNFGVFNEIYAKYFTSKPARSCVEVSALPKGVLVEIEAVAVIE